MRMCERRLLRELNPRLHTVQLRRLGGGLVAVVVGLLVAVSRWPFTLSGEGTPVLPVGRGKKK